MSSRPTRSSPCLEDFFLSSARVPVLLPARSASWDAERFNDAQGGEAELSDELAHADVHWSTPTALDEPGFVSAWEDSEYVDGDQQDIGESLYGVPFDDACSRAQDSGECFDGDVDVDFDVESDAVKPSFDRPNLSSFETSELMRRSNEEFWARQGKAPFNEPEYHLQAAERARWQVERCDDPAYAAERLHSICTRRCMSLTKLIVARPSMQLLLRSQHLFTCRTPLTLLLLWTSAAVNGLLAICMLTTTSTAPTTTRSILQAGRRMTMSRMTLARRAMKTASGSVTCKRSTKMPRQSGMLSLAAMSMMRPTARIWLAIRF